MNYMKNDTSTISGIKLYFYFYLHWKYTKITRVSIFVITTMCRTYIDNATVCRILLSVTTGQVLRGLYYCRSKYSQVVNASNDETL